MIMPELHRSTPKKKSVPLSLCGMNIDCEGWRQICSNLVSGIKSVRTLRVVLHIPADYYTESV